MGVPEQEPVDITDGKPWRVWLASEGIRNAHSPDSSNDLAQISAFPLRLADAGMATCFLLAISALVASLYFAEKAIVRGQAYTLYLLVLAHLPLAALGIWIRQQIQAFQKERGELKDRPGHLGAFAEAILSDSGIWYRGKRIQEWSACRGVAFVEAQEQYFLLRVDCTPGSSGSGQEGRWFTRLFGLWERFRQGARTLFSAIALLLLLLSPFVLTVIVFFAALQHYGWRADVFAAFWVLLAHCLILLGILLQATTTSSRSSRAEQKTHRFLVFDSSTVSATEVLRFIEQRIGERGQSE